MNLLLFTDADRVASGRIEVRDSRLQHLRDVSGVQVGDELRVGELNGLLGRGTVVAITDQQCVLDIALELPPPQKLPVTLVLALPRPKMLRRILRNVAEFGVAELHLINSYRVENSYWQSPVLGAAAIEHYLLQGLSQSIDTVVPAVHQHALFKPFAEDRLPGILRGRSGLVAHPGASSACPYNTTDETVLVVGPEGGFTDYEVTKLAEAGCEPVQLGPRILRVENAVSHLISRLF